MKYFHIAFPKNQHYSLFKHSDGGSAYFLTEFEVSFHPFTLSPFQLNKTTKKSRINFLLYIYNKPFLRMFTPCFKLLKG